MKGLLRFVFLFPLFVIGQEVVLDLGAYGAVRYECDKQRISRVVRLSPEGEELYSHGYVYDQDGRLVSENLIGGLGQIIHHKDGSCSTPFERVAQNPLQDFIVEQGDCEYDSRGCLIRFRDTYYEYDDHLNLTRVSSGSGQVCYGYDCDGRRVSRSEDGKVEHFAYAGLNNLAISTDDGVEQLRIPGISFHPQVVRAIAIETKGGVYAPIHNSTGNIVQLVHMDTKQVIDLGNDDPFGRTISKDAPAAWTFSGKHYDGSTELVYFGSRYYSPRLKEWLTPDPMHQVQDYPYQYCFDHPESYFDPDGNWVFVIPLTLEAGPWVYAGAYALAGYLVTKVGEMANEEIARVRREEERRRLNYLLSGEMQQYPMGYGFSHEMDKLEWENQVMERRKKKHIKEDLLTAEEMEKDNNYIDESHPEAKKHGRTTYRDKRTGEIIEHDAATPGKPGHGGRDHYHIRNPKSTGDDDKYLDSDGNPTGKNSDSSHIYPKEG